MMYIVSPGSRAYTSWGASRKQVDKAGLLLRDFWASPAAVVTPEVEESFEIAWAYRAEFQVPLVKVVMGVRSFMKTEGVPVVVGQRLKRMPTILDKLSRHRNMKLTRMQDIGGCRAIFPAGDYAAIARVRARMRKQKWAIAEEYDYINAPKATGYRAVHVVVSRENRLVEIQLRTRGQHAWAEAVERLGSRTGYNLKDGDGPEELLAYLERAGYATALQEHGEPIPQSLRKELEAFEAGARPYFMRG